MQLNEALHFQYPYILSNSLWFVIIPITAKRNNMADEENNKDPAAENNTDAEPKEEMEGTTEAPLQVWDST